MEAYIDDMVVKSKKVEDHFVDLEETFSVLRKHKLRLNASKCSFWVSSGKFLRYMITHWGIEVNLDQIKAIMRLHPPRNPKEVQRLTGMALMRKSDYIGRVAKWGTRLGAYDVKYLPRIAVKGQVLADFVTEFTKGNFKKEEVILAVTSARSVDVLPWEVYTDGASNRKGVGIGIVLITLERLVMEKSLRLGFIATNNEAEYKAFLAGALMVQQMGGEVVEVYCFFRLVVGQINGEFEARDERMQGYLSRVKGALSRFKSFVVKHIPRGQNAYADSLAMLATSLGSKLPWVVLVQDMMNSSLASISAVGIHSIQVGPSWMDPIVTFLKQGTLPEDKVEAEKVHRNAPRYWLSEEHKLYRRSYSEATNKVILSGLKKRLDDAKGRRVEELPHVLWTYRTTPRKSTSETPFSMTYGMEAVIPLKSRFPTLKSEQYSIEGNHRMLLDNLDTVEERREVASVKMANYQQKLKQTYDEGVKPRPLVPGDLVLRKVVVTAKNLAWSKLGPNLEGPYRITSVAGIGAYYLEDLDEKLECKQSTTLLLLNIRSPFGV
ncbi:uncharacterized protein LOC142644058 [Castanea sativa]|uniref:uncharacterized protein LOC142644058 n=1 Tax=Castanea sativa TaxID=21020 RepID=UPI003F64F49F